jgi:hypothetical protein
MADTGIDAVGQHEIDDAELAAERDSGLGAPIGQLIQAAAAAAGQHHRIGIFGDAADKAQCRFAGGEVIFFLQVTRFGFHYELPLLTLL